MNGASLIDEAAATAVSVALAVLPLAAIFIVLQTLLLKLPRKDMQRIVAGTCVAAVGLFLFLLGVGIGFMPFGRAIGEALGALEQKWILVAAGLSLGFVTTWGEPAVRILANEVEDATNRSIRQSLVLPVICIGVAAFVGMGMLRIVYDIPLLYFVVPGYLSVAVMMWFSERSFVAIAADAGGVATGPLANTFLLALALGASASVGHTDPIVSGLGLVSLIALAPMFSVMALGVLIRRKQRRQKSPREP